MKFAAYLLVFLALFAFTFAEDSLTISADCVIGEVNLQKGEIHNPIGECSEYTCQGSGIFTRKICSFLAAPPECKHIAQDNSKPYPECCTRYEC